MEYIIVEAESAAELVEQVNETIDRGFEPFGALTIIKDKRFDVDGKHWIDIPIFYQPMIGSDEPSE